MRLHSSIPANPQHSYFNPRIPAGCDESHQNELTALREFQSTHPCGMRQEKRAYDLYVIMTFQSTHPCGMRRPSCHNPDREKQFQSTHPCGMRLMDKLLAAQENDVFQSTHPCGMRQRAVFGADG